MLTRRIAVAAGCAGFLTLGAMVGCEAPRSRRGPLLIFPPPPAEPRIQFLTWASGADQVGSLHTTLEAFVLGDEVVDRRRITKPYGLAARDGVVYVCDSKGLALIRMDFKEHYMDVIGTRGPGRLLKPVNVVTDPLGYNFVVDPGRGEIVVFSPKDEYVKGFKLPEPCHPVDAALYGNDLYVLDNDSTPQIVVLNRESGEVIRTFGSGGKEPGQFHIPNSLSIGPEGYIYVSDTMNFRIQKLTREGEPVWAKGGPGYFPGQFGRPRGIRVGPDGVVYVVDGASERVQMFNSDGKVLMFFGGPGSTPGAMILPSSLAIDKTSIPYFQEYVHEGFKVEYLLFVANQLGQHLINVYAFGSFPEGFELPASKIERLPEPESDAGIGPLDELTPLPGQASEKERPPTEEPD